MRAGCFSLPVHSPPPQFGQCPRGWHPRTASIRLPHPLGWAQPTGDQRARGQSSPAPDGQQLYCSTENPRSFGSCHFPRVWFVPHIGWGTMTGTISCCSSSQGALHPLLVPLNLCPYELSFHYTLFHPPIMDGPSASCLDPEQLSGSLSLAKGCGVLQHRARAVCKPGLCCEKLLHARDTYALKTPLSSRLS